MALSHFQIFRSQVDQFVPSLKKLNLICPVTNQNGKWEMVSWEDVLTTDSVPLW